MCGQNRLSKPVIELIGLGKMTWSSDRERCMNVHTGMTCMSLSMTYSWFVGRRFFNSQSCYACLQASSCPSWMLDFKAQRT